MLYENAMHAADYIRERTVYRPRIAVILGSGLGSLGDQVEDAEYISPLREEFSPICHNPLLARQIISIAFRIRHCCSSDNCLNFL